MNMPCLLAHFLKYVCQKHIQCAKQGQLQPRCYIRGFQHHLQSQPWKVITVNFTEEAALLPTSPHSLFLLHSLSLPVLLPDKSLLPLGSVGFMQQRGISSGLGMHADHNNSLALALHPYPGIHAELRLTTSLVSCFLFWLTGKRSPHSKFIKALFLRITHKAYLRAGSQGKKLYSHLLGAPCSKSSRTTRLLCNRYLDFSSQRKNTANFIEMLPLKHTTQSPRLLTETKMTASKFSSRDS